MGTLSDRLEQIGEKARQTLAAKDAAREMAIPLSRDAVRYSSDAIRAIHRSEFEKGKELLDSARLVLKELDKALSEHQELIDAGFVYNGQKEYVEGRITLALIAGGHLPDADELGMGYAAYLNGMGEAVGELRRHLLDVIRKGELARCEGLMATMDDIYGVLVTIDFPDAVTGGLRRTTDAVRGILERTRGDLTLSIRQRHLEEKLAAFEERQSGKP